jgi:peptide/nickel transport system permease protein
MVALIQRRLLGAIPVLLGVSFVVFVAIQLVPGDVARFVLGHGATEENVQALREQLGLNRPVLVQYGVWLGNVLQGDFGRSIAHGVPVATVILDKIGASLLLMAASLVIVLVLGIGLAAFSGGHHRSLRDRVVVVAMLLCASMPPFWLGIVLLYVFGLKLKLFPISGMVDMAHPGGWPDVLRHLVLPAVTTAVSSLAVVTRVTRSRMIDMMAQPFILSARARGLSERRVIYVEAARNVLPTFVAISGLQIGYIFGNAVFSEVVFNWPGIGLQLYQAIIQRDFPVVQGSVLAIAAVFVLGNLVADVLAAVLDPRRSA